MNLAPAGPEAPSWPALANPQFDLAFLTREWRDFGEGAAMVEQLDLVVSVDTVTVHLAGAVGTPAFVLLPPNPGFRCLLDREDSPWYPGLRLFRRDTAEPRPAQVARVVQAVQERTLHSRGGGNPGLPSSHR